VGARARENPTVDVAAGPRWASETTTDVEVSLAVPVDLAGRRGARIAAAEAEAARDERLAEDAVRAASGEAVAAFYRVLFAERRLKLSEDWLALAEELHRTAVERQRAGDIAQFEVNLADADVGRAASAVAAEKSLVARARGQLAAALGLAELPAVEGDLGDRRLFDTTSAATRDDLRAAAAERDVARAEASLSDARRWPGIDLRVSYAREEDADILLGGIGITLPLFDRGQGDAARAGARRERAEAELDAKTTAATAEAAGAREAYRLAIEAVAILEQRALPRAVENEALAREAYRAGKIDLAAFLLIRRDALDVRREHLDRLLEAALAGIDLWVAVGAPTAKDTQP
jgi:cobalt-zinc-cadmium efflux system outer membrane protein